MPDPPTPTPRDPTAPVGVSKDGGEQDLQARRDDEVQGDLFEQLSGAPRADQERAVRPAEPRSFETEREGDPVADELGGGAGADARLDDERGGGSSVETA